MAFDVDFFVIGAGSGGVRAARIAAGHGAKTLVAEESRIGGTCVIRGCVPKKLYVIASRFADDFRDAAGFGWSVGEPTFDWPTLVAAKDKEISRLSDAYRQNLARSGAKLVEQRATVVDPHRVRLADGREISARHILIACGSRPVMPTGVEGIEHAITSNEVFDLPVFPRRLLVVGGGYIAVEFASLFQRLGREVTMVMRGPNLLRGFDEDMREGMRDAMAQRRRCLSVWLPADCDREEGRRLVARDAVRRLGHRSRSGADRDRPQAQHAGPRPRSRRRRAQRRAWRGEGRRESDQQRALDPRDRRRHPPGRPDPGRHSRGPYAGRPAVRPGRARRSATTRSASTVFGTPELGAVGLTRNGGPASGSRRSTSTRPISGR